MPSDIEAHFSDKYCGLWLVLDPDRQAILGSGADPDEVLRQAKRNGNDDPILTYLFAHGGDLSAEGVGEIL